MKLYPVRVKFRVPLDVNMLGSVTEINHLTQPAEVWMAGATTEYDTDTDLLLVTFRSGAEVQVFRENMSFMVMRFGDKIMDAKTHKAVTAPKAAAA